jgi:hypothetical protein
MMKKILIAVLILSLSVSLYAKPVPKKKSLINIAYEPYFFYQPVEENLTLYANLLLSPLNWLCRTIMESNSLLLRD